MIRIATYQDIPDITKLMKSVPGFWQDSWREDVLVLAMESAHAISFIWEDGEGIAGFACAHDLGFRGYLSALVVADRARRKGIGKQLVQRIEIELRQRGCTTLIADVWRDAEGLYRSLGWSTPDVSFLRKNI